MNGCLPLLSTNVRKSPVSFLDKFNLIYTFVSIKRLANEIEVYGSIRYNCFAGR